MHVCKDGELIVAHDETIDRVSDGSGLICEMTTAELKKHRFNKTHPEYKNATVPTLGEVYELLKPYGLHINVELKNSRIRYPHLEEKCVELAAKMGMSDRILYSSFNHHSLLYLKQLDPTLKCGTLYDATLIRPWDYAHNLGMNAIHPHFSELQIEGECAHAHALGLEVNPWTVNEEKGPARHHPRRRRPHHHQLPRPRARHPQGNDRMILRPPRARTATARRERAFPNAAVSAPPCFLTLHVL